MTQTYVSNSTAGDICPIPYDWRLCFRKSYTNRSDN